MGLATPDIAARFAALGDPTRLALVAALVDAPQPVSVLAAPFAMTLPAVTQHLQVLERAGLVASQKTGRVRTYQLVPDALRDAEAWLADRRATWERRFDRLGAVLDAMPDDDDDDDDNDDVQI